MRRLCIALALAAAGCAIEVPGAEGNQPPVIGVLAASPSSGLQPGQALTVTVGATDPDGDPVQYAWAVSGGTLLASAGPRVTWNPPSVAGRHTIRVLASDGRGGAAAGYLSLDVSASGVGLDAPLILRPAPIEPSPSPAGSASPSPSASLETQTNRG